MRFNSYWLQMSLRSLGLPFMRSLMLQILVCIPRCFHLLYGGTMNFSSGLNTAPWHHSSWTGLPFLQWCHCTRHIILHFEMSSLALRNKSSFFFAYRRLCMRSFLQVQWICMVRTFHKEYSYWQILMHKFIWSCNYFSQYNIHPYLTETF